MEQKKLLLVAISVGVFLVIAIGAAVLVFGSGGSSSVMASTRVISPGTPAVQEPQVNLYPAVVHTPAYAAPAENPPDPVAGTAQGAAQQPQVNPPVVNQGKDTEAAGDSSVVINVTRPSTAAVPDVPPVVKQVNQPVPKTTAPASPAPASKPASSSAQTAPAPKSSPAPAAQPAPSKPAPKINDDFWVQTGSFSTITRAEGVKDTLAAKGITSIIENRVLDSTTYYRVRVGPYTSKNEADYWLGLIRSINGFENSLVLASQSVR